MNSEAAAESQRTAQGCWRSYRSRIWRPQHHLGQHANKKGTIYWAVTLDRQLRQEWTLLNPSSYNPKIVKSGTLKPDRLQPAGSVKISGLTSDGSYCLCPPPSLWTRGRAESP